MKFDFTVAITPGDVNIERELQYIKSALLYADRVKLISPIAYMFTQFTDLRNQKNEYAVMNLLFKAVHFIEDLDQELYQQSMSTCSDLSKIIKDKSYKARPILERIKLREELKKFAIEIGKKIYSLIGQNESSELQRLINNQQVVIEEFDHLISDVSGSVNDYFQKLNKSINDSFPLFDEQSYGLMRSAVKAKIINLSPLNKAKLTHAGVTDNYIQKLPSFERASIDEILDIKKEFEKPLIRYRSMMLKYTESIQSLPWDDDFAVECNLIYDKEIAPELLEIQELTKENSFIKNLGWNMLTDKTIISKEASGLVVTLAAGGVISSFSEVLSTNGGVLLAGGAWTAQKIASAYREYSNKRKDIERKDLFFYYQAGKELQKNL